MACIIVFECSRVSTLRGSCTLTSADAGTGAGEACVRCAGCSGWESLAAAFSANKASMWPLVGASLFQSEAVEAGASEGGGPTLPV